MFPTPTGMPHGRVAAAAPPIQQSLIIARWVWLVWFLVANCMRGVVLVGARVTAMAQQPRQSAHRKDLWILRHGQAAHNPRAEAARYPPPPPRSGGSGSGGGNGHGGGGHGCTHAEFLELMRQDDALDAPLTALGVEQARRVWEDHGSQYWRTGRNSSNSGNDDDDDNRRVTSTSPPPRPELVVSSPLSRALRTADLALGNLAVPKDQKVCYEGFREINGWLLNAQRRPTSILAAEFDTWNFDGLDTEDDVLWQPACLEDEAVCAERGYGGLAWLWRERTEKSILLVTHGGLLRFLTRHPRVHWRDARTTATDHNTSTDHSNCSSDGTTTSAATAAAIALRRPVDERYRNGELRRYRMECENMNDDELAGARNGKHTTFVLTEIDLDHDFPNDDDVE